MRIACIAIILAAGACASKPIVEESPYQGPPITVDSSGPRHTAVFQAPSSGYRVQFDRKERRFGSTDVFMTITRPDPAQMHAQTLVDLNLDTTVSTREPIDLYARVRDFGTSGDKDPYRPVVSPAR